MHRLDRLWLQLVNSPPPGSQSRSFEGKYAGGDSGRARGGNGGRRSWIEEEEDACLAAAARVAEAVIGTKRGGQGGAKGGCHPGVGAGGRQSAVATAAMQAVAAQNAAGMPYILPPTPYTVHLHLAPYTIHPTPYIVKP